MVLNSMQPMCWPWCWRASTLSFICNLALVGVSASLALSWPVSPFIVFQYWCVSVSASLGFCTPLFCALFPSLGGCVGLPGPLSPFLCLPVICLPAWLRCLSLSVSNCGPVVSRLSVFVSLSLPFASSFVGWSGGVRAVGHLCLPLWLSIFPNSVNFGVFSHRKTGKGLGANWHTWHSSGRFLSCAGIAQDVQHPKILCCVALAPRPQRLEVASQKVLWRTPQSTLYNGPCRKGGPHVSLLFYKHAPPSLLCLFEANGCSFA